MTSKIHFITYGNETYENNMNRIIAEAHNTGWFTTSTPYRPHDLSEDFRNKYNDILVRPRGAGYWIWKFDIIKQHLYKIDNDDFLIYMDAGSSINPNGKKRFDEYIDMLNKSNEGIISFEMQLQEKTWTTRQIFQHFNLDLNSDYGNSGQIVGGILIMKKNEKLLKIIDECFKVLTTNRLLFTDHYNDQNQESYFKDNRHDQSIFSLIRKIHGSVVLGHETYFHPFGNDISLQYPFWATQKRT
jgi:hypothetical protein